MIEESATANTAFAPGLPPTGKVAGAPDEETDAVAIKPNSRRRKMLIILGIAVLGGVILGASSAVLLSYLKPGPREPANAHIADHRQDALIEELKTKNQQLETRIKQSDHAAPHGDNEQTNKPEEAFKPPQPATQVRNEIAPPVVHGKFSGTKVAEDCTVTDKTEKLGEKLKSCIEGFNSATR
jgi:hypothetical protein